jgi:hypothetical protein
MVNCGCFKSINKSKVKMVGETMKLTGNRNCHAEVLGQQYWFCYCMMVAWFFTCPLKQVVALITAASTMIAFITVMDWLMLQESTAKIIEIDGE